MTIRRPAHPPSLALLTDLYELTMANGYWKSRIAGREASFNLLFRKTPFGSGFAILAGLDDVIDVLANFRFTSEDIDYLATLTGSEEHPLFDQEFLEYLHRWEFACDVDAVPEGTAVFAHEPLFRVKGPIEQAQIVESVLLNIINFQTLIATKAARICLAARGEPVLEFGLRRAHGTDGALSASRAAYIGGCAATSNVLAGRLFGIPVKGTHAHSWVMAFGSEEEAFSAWADAMPHNSIFLVDTFDTLEGVRTATRMGHLLRERGHDLMGVRLDSGDLAWLSIKARQILDEAGFEKAVIVASNDLDEEVITSLKQQGAAINVWGVGTRLVTGHHDGALGGVYKLSAIRADSSGKWEPRIKLSEHAAKTSIPGVLNVRRFRDGDQFLGDMIFNEADGPPSSDEQAVIVDPADPYRHKKMPSATAHEDLLAPVFRGGRMVYGRPGLAEIRERTQAQLASVHASVKRLLHPHEYPVGIDSRLHKLRTALVGEARRLHPLNGTHESRCATRKQTLHEQPPSNDMP